MEFEIKCHLGYEVSGPAAFLFNVAVAQNSFQRIITEHFDLALSPSPFSLSPFASPHVFVLPPVPLFDKFLRSPGFYLPEPFFLRFTPHSPAPNICSTRTICNIQQYIFHNTQTHITLQLPYLLANDRVIIV